MKLNPLHFFPIAVSLLLFAFLISSTNASRLLPLDSTELWPSDRLLIDPFRVLDHLPFPFTLNKDDQFEMSGANVDWKETPDSHLIIIDVPGMKKDELKIEIDQKNRILKVNGERKREEEKKEDQWHRVERSYGKFLRQFRMPENVDLDLVKAKLDDGVLKVTLAKVAPEKIKNPVKVVSVEEEGKEEGGGMIKEVSDRQADGGSKQEL